MVLGFFELPTDQVPPSKFWHSQQHLQEWFDAVEQKRSDKAAGFTPIEADEDMMENELARGLRD